MDTMHHSGASDEKSETRTVRVFICYRRDDASFAAKWLFALLDNHAYQDRDGLPCKLKVYFDQAEPGVANWKALHEPALQSASALVVVCSHGLATDFSKSGGVDWTHRELGWWIDNRGAAPIVVDLTESERWIPERIRTRWPDLNRLKVVADELRRSAPGSNDDLSESLRRRIVATIVESEHATTYEELGRIRKKNTLLTVVSVVAAVAFIAALIGWWRAHEAQTRATASQKIAEDQKEVSRNTVRFLTRLFEGADPDGYYGDKLTVTQLLKTAPATIEMESSPILKANLLRALGSVYAGVGEYDSAIDSLTKAGEILQENKVGGEDEFRVTLSLGEALLNASEDVQPALPHLERAERLAGSIGVDRSERATAKIALGDFHAWSKPPKRDKAKSQYEEALALDREAPADWIAVARDHNRLGKLALDSQDYSDARTNFASSLEAVKEFPSKANVLFSQQYEHDYAAALYEDTGPNVLDDLLARYSASSDAFKAAYGEDSVEYGIAENNVARILFELDNLEPAATRADSAVKIESAALGPEFSELAFAHNTHALTLRAMGKVGEAKQAFRKAADLAQENNLAIGAQSLGGIL